MRNDVRKWGHDTCYTRMLAKLDQEIRCQEKGKSASKPSPHIDTGENPNLYPVSDENTKIMLTS